MKKLNIETPTKISTSTKKLISEENVSKSSKIKQLFDLGYSVKEISTLLDIRYNFAYNVISNYILMEDIEVSTERKESKKDKIIDLHIHGKTKKEISKELKTNYNYVYNTIKKYETENQQIENVE